MKLEVMEVLDFLKENSNCFQYYGNRNAEIRGFCSLSNLKPQSVTWIKHLESFDIKSIDKCLNLLIITNSPDDCFIPEGYNIILCNNPKAVFFSILNRFWGKPHQYGIAKSSIIETSTIGENVSIGHNCYIGPDVVIGDDVLIEHGVSILCKTNIGSRTIIHSGVVIGTDGYGYYSDIRGNNVKVDHFGGVTIGKDVEIGANTCIDRGTLDDTIIGDNVKIDNLCHIAHNVIVEENSMVIALSMLGGSSVLRKSSYIAPGALIMNQVSVGEGSLVGLGAVVIKDVPDNKVVAGVPARILKDK